MLRGASCVGLGETAGPQAGAGLQPSHSSGWAGAGLDLGEGRALVEELEGAVSFKKWSRMAR